MAVDNQHKLYSESKEDWEQVRDCLAGERTVKSKGELYLPKLSGMTDEDYTRYKKKVHFFGATARVADGLHGAVFSKPPQVIGDMSGEFSETLKDVDLEGTSLLQFSSDVIWDAMMTNWGGILVDYSKDAEKVSLAEAKAKGYGAFMKWYPAEYVINWRYGLVKGRERLVLVVLKEPYAEAAPTDIFSEKAYTRYRVLRLEKNPDGSYGNYIQEVYDEKIGLKSPSDSAIEPVMNGKRLTFIPFYTVPGKLPEKSMLLDLSYMNIGHYQESADYQNGKQYTSIPTPYATNVSLEIDESTKKPIPVHIGGTKFLTFNNETGAPIHVGFLEFTGSGMNALKDGINLTESQMAILGAHIITAEKKGVESAAVAGIHRAGENGVLGAFARNTTEQITKAVRCFGEWNGYSEAIMSEFDYQLNTDYDLSENNASILSVLLQGRQAGEFPKIVLFRFLKKLQAIPEDWDFDMFLEETDKDTVKVEPLILDEPKEDDEPEENNEGGIEESTPEEDE